MSRPNEAPSPGPLNIAVCAPQVPLVSGGAEEHVQSMCRELEKRGHRVSLVTMPYKWYPRRQLLRSMDMWELADLSESDGRSIDLLISTKFPSYFVRHPRHVLWLIHQYRQAYDLYGSPHSEFSPARWRDRRFRSRFIARDSAALARIPRRFTNAGNTRDRLLRFNGLHSQVLYHPPRLAEQLSCRRYGDFILSVGRLDRLKRVDLLLSALAGTEDKTLKAVITGRGPEEENLKNLAVQLGIASRVEFTGYVDDQRLIDLYADCLAVWFAPLDEDYGYITLEAFYSCKPVLTARDSGGPLEFVRHGHNGYILTPGDSAQAAVSLDRLRENPEKAAELGRNGRESVRDISWDQAIPRLLEENE